MISKFLCIACASAIFISCRLSSGQAAKVYAGYDQLDKYLQSLTDTAGIPGIAVAITRDTDIVYAKAFGVTDLQTMQKLIPRNTFHIASISKTFTATAVMQLAEKGKIDITKPLITYLPYFRLNDERYPRITIKQMLNHTSGMPDVEDYEWEKAVADEGAAERYVRSLANEKMISNPGAEFHYSNMAFDVMADLIAKVSGKPFEEYVKENILKPLEMNESSFYLPDIKKSMRTSPHTGNPPAVSPVYPYNRMHAPSSTLNTNVLDLAHWAIANIHDGEYKGKHILSTETHSLMWHPTFVIDNNNSIAIGLSWFIIPFRGMTTYEHSGSDLGYRSSLTLIPGKRTGIIILCNRNGIEIDGIRDRIEKIIFAGG